MSVYGGVLTSGERKNSKKAKFSLDKNRGNVLA